MSAAKYVDWVLEKAGEECERARACLWRGTDVEVDPVVKRVAGKAMAERVVRRGEFPRRSSIRSSPALQPLTKLWTLRNPRL